MPSRHRITILMPVLLLTLSALSGNCAVGQDRQAAIAAVDGAIAQVQSLLGNPPVTDQSNFAVVELQNPGPKKLKLFVSFEDQGQIVNEAQGDIARKSRRRVNALPGDVLSIERGGKVVAEYLVNDFAGQLVNLQKLEALWSKRPEEERVPLPQLNVVFEDYGPEPLKIYLRDPKTGKLPEKPDATLKAESKTSLLGYPGNVFVLKDSNNRVVGEYEVAGVLIDAAGQVVLDQSVPCGKLRKAWQKQAEPRHPLTLKLSLPGLVFGPSGTDRVKRYLSNNTSVPVQVYIRFQDIVTKKEKTVKRGTPIAVDQGETIELAKDAVLILKDATDKTKVLAWYKVGSPRFKGIQINTLAMKWQAYRDMSKPLTNRDLDAPAPTPPDHE